MASIYTKKVTKHPDSKRLFTIDLTRWLANLGDGTATIDTAEWDAGSFTIEGSGSVDADNLIATSPLVVGGSAQPSPYPLVCTVTTSTGEIQPFTFLVEVTSP